MPCVDFHICLVRTFTHRGGGWSNFDGGCAGNGRLLPCWRNGSRFPRRRLNGFRRRLAQFEELDGGFLRIYGFMDPDEGVGELWPKWSKSGDVGEKINFVETTAWRWEL